MGREIKTVKIPVGRPGKQERVLAKEAAAGWRLVEIVKGPVLRSYDVAHLEREARPEPVRAASPRFGARPGKHSHEWSETTSADDERNSVRVFECGCGQVKTESA